jgi:hypothetical protein
MVVPAQETSIFSSSWCRYYGIISRRGCDKCAGLWHQGAYVCISFQEFSRAKKMNRSMVVSDFVSKTGFGERAYHIPLYNSPGKVRFISSGTIPTGLRVTGESLVPFPGNFCRMKEQIRKVPFTGVSFGGIYCPGEGCNHCMHEQCIYADFIRHYWMHPRFD